MEKKDCNCVEFLNFLKNENVSFDEIKDLVKTNKLLTGKTFPLEVKYKKIEDSLVEIGIVIDEYSSVADIHSYPQWQLEELAKESPKGLESRVVNIEPPVSLKFNATLVPYNTTPSEASKELKDQGFIVAGLHEVLALQKEFPELHKYASVVSAGTTVASAEDGLTTFMVCYFDYEKKIVPVYYDQKAKKNRFLLALKKVA